MKNVILMLLSMLIISLFSGCSKTEVGGEVFVVTKGQTNVKLGLVTVYFLTETQFKEASDTNSITYLKTINLCNTLDSLRNYNRYLLHKGFVKSYQDILQSATGQLREYYTDTQRSEFRSTIKEYDSTAIDCLKETKVRFRTDIRAQRASIEYYLIANEQVISDKTNSDGKFNAKLKNEKYYVFANSTRKVAANDEEYHWLFTYIPTNKPLLLSNDNMMPF